MRILILGGDGYRTDEHQNADILRQRHVERDRVGVCSKHYVEETVHAVADHEKDHDGAVAFLEWVVREQEKQ